MDGINIDFRGKRTGRIKFNNCIMCGHNDYDVVPVSLKDIGSVVYIVCKNCKTAFPIGADAFLERTEAEINQRSDAEYESFISSFV